jgi:hypothetical protein
MPGAGRRFYFEGKVPLVFSVVAALLFANAFLMLLLEFVGKHFPREVPMTVHWYGDNSITIQLVLAALLAVIVIIFRKRIEWVDTRRRAEGKRPGR